jgi:(p)ppGpp synthase/HD superfamily hydrolase
MHTLTVGDVDAIAAAAHADQVDKGGRLYIAHPRCVAAGLAPFGDTAQMAALLHDVVEDTTETLASLRDRGVPEQVLVAVAAVTRQPGTVYMQMIREIAAATDWLPRPGLTALGISTRVALSPLVKLADNAHNSRRDRQAALEADVAAGLSRRYARARAQLVPAVGVAAARVVFERVNPDLLSDLG